MKNYLLFMGQNYYPGGGAEDLLGSYETIEEAIQRNESELSKDYISEEMQFVTKEEYVENAKDNTWAHIYDLENQKIVWEQK